MKKLIAAAVLTLATANLALAADTITLRHTARNREGFARGALKAARYIAGRKGFYEFSEISF